MSKASFWHDLVKWALDTAALPEKTHKVFQEEGLGHVGPFWEYTGSDIP